MGDSCFVFVEVLDLMGNSCFALAVCNSMENRCYAFVGDNLMDSYCAFVDNSMEDSYSANNSMEDSCELVDGNQKIDNHPPKEDKMGKIRD